MYKLYNGFEIPNLCYGTGVIYKKQFLKTFNTFRSLKYSLNNGLNFFDTSRAYCDAEFILGKSLIGTERKKYFISTKLCNKDQYKKNVRLSFEKSLKEMNVEYIDIYLMHWPVEDVYLHNWKEMEKIYEDGLCKAIGVCNCNVHHLEKLFSIAHVKPMVNQFECHPLFTQKKLREYCKKNEIQVLAYTALARMDDRLSKTVLVDIAKKYKKTVPQIILRWHQQIGNIPIFNTTVFKHIDESLNISDFNMLDDEINIIEEININSRLRYDPDNCDFTKL